MRQPGTVAWALLRQKYRSILRQKRGFSNSLPPPRPQRLPCNPRFSFLYPNLVEYRVVCLRECAASEGNSAMQMKIKCSPTFRLSQGRLKAQMASRQLNNANSFCPRNYIC